MKMSLNKSDSATPQAIDVDPAGDVVLMVGYKMTGDEDDETWLRVSSKVLSLASPVFAAMVSPKWSDSANKASSSEPQYIALPEDDPSPMEWICQILHFRKDVSTNKNIQFFVNVAQLCDKYDLVSPIKLWVDFCLQSPKTTTPDAIAEVDLTGLMYISCVLRNSETFWSSSAMLLYAIPPPDFMCCQYELGCFPKTPLENYTFAWILDERQNILNRLRSLLDGMIGPSLIDLHEPEAVVPHLQELTRIGLWPLSEGFHKASTQDVLKKLDKYQPCNQSHCACSRLGLGDTVEAIKREFSDQRGLCLECYKNGKTTRLSGNCMACQPAFCGRADEEIDRPNLGS